MSEIDAPSPPSSTSRGRRKSRGGLGKYLRARGRGRGGGGRPAEFVQRLVLEDEEQVELDEEDVNEVQAKYGARGLRSNADRYVEAEPVDHNDEQEPEVDLSAFLEKQRTRISAGDVDELPIIGITPSNHPTDMPGPEGSHTSYGGHNAQDEEEVDRDLERMISSSKKNAQMSPLHRKNNKQVVEWDQEMETMQREKRATEAMRDLKTRLQGSQKIKQTRTSAGVLVRGKAIADTRAHSSITQNDAEAFLDDLLA